MMCGFFFFKQKTAYEMRISDWSSDVCSSDLREVEPPVPIGRERAAISDRELVDRVTDARCGRGDDVIECQPQRSQVPPDELRRALALGVERPIDIALDRIVPARLGVPEQRQGFPGGRSLRQCSPVSCPIGAPEGRTSVV